ncbi:MmcQ/YjbR family DNA-binding protein [Aquimarina agarilytica]|uniref:MmcQ/YjbR family DNA-binding protein n=1 Tax=Aquimarina agarilytica TaxID=1087449 RepID=UPI000288FD66|nr:MmcQ/YjbR family DNA-binding protein [Aquimarina agarilytica]
MDIETYRNYCLNKKGVSESFPFDEAVLVFKVLNKVFALGNINSRPLKINLKCDPEKAITYREHYPEITPGYHMNKKHWNTVDFQGSIPDKILYQLVDHSYDLVVSKLTKKQKEALNEL